MKRLRHILRFAPAILGVMVLLVVLGFVESTAGRTPISGVEVHVGGAEGVHFIDEHRIREEVLDMGMVALGRPMREVDLGAIERRLRNMPAVARAEVFHTHDGILHVRTLQREPIVRVMPHRGAGFYIDSEGWTLPTGSGWTARVPVVTGALKEPGSAGGVQQVHGSDSLCAITLSDDIHRLFSFIRKDPFLDALIDQAVVEPDGSFTLLPTVGGHRILIGKPANWPGEDELTERTAKLKHFYAKGIPQSDWRKHQSIDLRFAGQVVCTERRTP